MGRIAPQPGIMEIALYEGGASHLPGRAEVLKLSSNENPAGPPESAQAALVAAAGELHRYPPTDHRALREAIGRAHGLDPERIICGVGSDEILTFLCQAYAGPGDEVIHTEHGFAMYRISALAAGATPVEVAERARVVDVDAILAAVTERTRLVIIANPANPTGTMIPLADAARLADGLPESCLLVLDGAYAEYAEGYDGGAALAGTRGNVVMTRTFSKLYGLGGLRVGWGYAEAEIIGVLNRVRGPFNLSGPALAAAEAAVNDRAFAERTLAENARLRARMVAELRAMGLGCDESHANFVLARFAAPEAALACEAHLRGEGIIVRKTANYGLPEALRITVGTEADCDRVLSAIRGWRAAAA
ncbi:histidinol-phosphate transaminase [Histidinibacterium lentulum]|uniref:Histidinol-phosphate aminotransferase n=1 Tax=Histidinibacterium lentulum TaxID=2480588 RepID=A0A3N2R806_9RHOB|nr:histidinol-phosphate transaminase [Histidinibacterium lentulum]ROU03543.1 histidinol-phosphate transaminase [Histidinibacterium lentulum]